jgi:hypothetical protein
MWHDPLDMTDNENLMSTILFSNEASFITVKYGLKSSQMETLKGKRTHQKGMYS